MHVVHVYSKGLICKFATSKLMCGYTINIWESVASAHSEVILSVQIEFLAHEIINAL